jgi:hypothetical protein
LWRKMMKLKVYMILLGATTAIRVSKFEHFYTFL